MDSCGCCEYPDYKTCMYAETDEAVGMLQKDLHPEFDPMDSHAANVQYLKDRDLVCHATPPRTRRATHGNQKKLKVRDR